jgi:hypothetical protein
MSALIEQWRALPGFEGWVDVSSFGRARRWYESSVGRRPPTRLAAPVLISFFERRGYLSFAARNAMQTGVCFSLHSAVLLTYSGPCAAWDVACHFPDPKRSNCRFDNLRWDSRSANHIDGKIHRSGLLERVAARLAILVTRFPHLRRDVEGIELRARPNPWQNNGAWMRHAAEAQRARVAGGAA